MQSFNEFVNSNTENNQPEQESAPSSTIPSFKDFVSSGKTTMTPVGPSPIQQAVAALPEPKENGSLSENIQGGGAELIGHAIGGLGEVSDFIGGNISRALNHLTGGFLGGKNYDEQSKSIPNATAEFQQAGEKTANDLGTSRFSKTLGSEAGNLIGKLPLFEIGGEAVEATQIPKILSGLVSKVPYIGKYLAPITTNTFKNFGSFEAADQHPIDNIVQNLKSSLGLGITGGVIQNKLAKIPAMGLFGYLSSKLNGEDNATSLAHGVLFGGMETAGLFGKDAPKTHDEAIKTAKEQAQKNLDRLQELDDKAKGYETIDPDTGKKIKVSGEILTVPEINERKNLRENKENAENIINSSKEDLLSGKEQPTKEDFNTVAEQVRTKPVEESPVEKPVAKVEKKTVEETKPTEEKPIVEGDTVTNDKGDEVKVESIKDVEGTQYAKVEGQDNLIPVEKLEKIKSPEVIKVPGEQLPVGEGETKISRLEARLKDKLGKVNPRDAEEAGLTTFKEMNKKENITKAAKYVSKNPEEVLAVLKGEKPAPEGLLHASIAIAAETHAELAGNADLIRKLATLRGTRAGQEVSILSEADPNNITSQTRQIQIAREEAAQKSFGKRKTTTKARNDIVNEGKKVMKNTKFKLEDAQKLLDSLIC